MKDQMQRGHRAVLERIVRTARASFASNGYAGTSLRSVALAAGVDPALLHYYFQNKSGLLEAALVPPIGFLEGIAEANAVPMQNRERSLVEPMLTVWEQPESAETLRSIILTARTNQAPCSACERYLRVGMIASHLVGLAMTRYVWQFALVDLPPTQIVELIAPTIQGYLCARLPEAT